MLRVGVLFGGKTVEHEVSIISAVQAMAAMDPEKYEVIPIYITKDYEWYTGDFLKDMESYRDMELMKRYAKQVVLCRKEGSFFLQTTGFFKYLYKELDLVFPIVHGNHTEDGSIQGYLTTLGIPYVGSSVAGSALGQDKVFMKQVFKENGLPVVDYVWFYDTEYFDNSLEFEKKIEKLGYPVVVKPATLGSSIGITKVEKKQELRKAIENAIVYDTKIVVEKAIEHLCEVNCSVIGTYEYQEASVLEEVVRNDAILSYQDKYLGSAKTKGMKSLKASKGMASTSRILPAKIDADLTKKIQDTSKEVFRVLGLCGVCRIDYLIDQQTKKYYINEPNTIPGSLSFYLWEETGRPYSSLLDTLITTAVKNYKAMEKKTTSFESNILSNYGGTKGFKGKLRK